MHTLLTWLAQSISQGRPRRRASASQHRNHEPGRPTWPRRDFNVPMRTFLLATRRAMNKTRRKRGRTLKRWQPVVIALLSAKDGDKVTGRETTLQLFSSPFLLALPPPFSLFFPPPSSFYFCYLLFFFLSFLLGFTGKFFSDSNF